MELYPYKFAPIYQERLWGGRNLQRLFGRRAAGGRKIGESWELADLAGGTSVVSNGPLAGRTLTELTGELGRRLLGPARATSDGRFPLLLKLLDAADVLSMQVHPDERAAAEIGGSAALKTECWYVLESRGGCIYKGLAPGTTRDQFRRAVEAGCVESIVRKIPVAAGEFHYLPAGTVHALGAGVVVAEVQTPSDTTCRLTDWGRGREIHVEQALRCVRVELTGDNPPGAGGDVLLATPFFVVRKLSGGPAPLELPGGAGGQWGGNCAAVMHVRGNASLRVTHKGSCEPCVEAAPGETVLLPAELPALLQLPAEATCLLITLPGPSEPSKKPPKQT
jgi:mannose-6-phosphate isomerase